MRIFFSAGEASGDAYAAELAKSIRALKPAAELEGLGGHRSRSAGIRTVVDTSTWGAIGITQALRVVPRAIGGYFKGMRALGHGEPGVFVPIDFGWVNIRFARKAKQLGWKVLYFVPPGSWRKDRQGADLPVLCDEIVTPFPWSAEILTKMGASAHFFGHPLKEMVAHAKDEPRIPGRIAVLPGSRRSEVELNLAVIAQTLKLSDTAEFAVAPSVEVEALKAAWSRIAPGRSDIFTQNDTYGVFKRAEAAIVCSGTATLEGVLCGCPMVVIYKLAKATEIEARLLMGKKIEFISLPNILLGRKVVEELIQDAATPEAIRSHLDRLRADTEERRAMLAAFAELNETLGPGDAISQAAQLIVALARRPKS